MDAGAFKTTCANVQPAQIALSKVTSGKIDPLCVDLFHILAAEIKTFEFAALSLQRRLTRTFHENVYTNLC
jgi:hypothetical protein